MSHLYDADVKIVKMVKAAELFADGLVDEDDGSRKMW